jgi:dTDP-4-amino-4,6-dideoxygalactose transaminase
MSRIYLSPPDVGPAEREALLRALDSNWVAPFGPELDAFEAEMAACTSTRHGVGLTSGTAALHLALVALGVGAGDDVLVPTLTFVASANAVRYVGATPVLVDSEVRSWNVDPNLVAEELETRAARGRKPAAVVVVDLYGQCADYEALATSCAEHDVPIIEDAAEALGATCGDRPAGSLGRVGVFSFNGNKIVTTSGGGMLVTDDEMLAGRVRHLANQARESALHYEHIELGYNYRLSNLLAALGRAQLSSLPERIERRSAIEARYRDALRGMEGVSFLPRAPWGRPNHWLTCVTVDGARATRDELIDALATADIEARPTWKPMHRQPLHRDAPAVLTGVADRVFETGLCLPSGSNLARNDQDRVLEILTSRLGA